MSNFLRSTALISVFAFACPAFAQDLSNLSKTNTSLSTLEQTIAQPTTPFSELDQAEVEHITLWQERISILIDRIEKDSNNYIIPEDIYSSRNLPLLDFYVSALNSFSMAGDYTRLLEQLRKVATEEESDRYLKAATLGEILNINDDTIIQAPSSQRTVRELAIDPDWYVALNAQALSLQSRLNSSHLSVIAMSEYATYVIPPKSDPLYHNAMYILSTMQCNEANYKLEYEAAYDFLLELIYYGEKSNQPEIILAHVQNIIASLVRKYGPGHFEEQSNRILQIDFPSDSYKSQNIFVHLSAYFGMDIEKQNVLLEESIRLGHNSDFFEKSTIRNLIRNALVTNNDAILEKYSRSDAYISQRNRNPDQLYNVFLELRNGDVTQSDALARISNDLRRKLNNRRRDLAAQRPYRENNTKLVLEDGRVITYRSDDKNIEEMINSPVDNILNDAQSLVLNEILDRIFLNEKFAKQPSFQNAAYAESFFSDNEQNYIETRPNFIAFNKGKNISVALSNFRHSYPKVYSRSLNLNAETLSNSDRAYTELLDINMLIRSGRVENVWPRLLELKAHNGMSGDALDHLLFDIKQTESNLLFLEGSLDDLLTHVNGMIEAAIQLKRRLNAHEYIAMIAISLAEAEYTKDGQKVIDAWISNGSSANHPDYLPLVLQGRLARKSSDKTNAANGLVRALEQANNKTDIVLIRSELLNFYTSITDIPMIERTRSLLLSEMQDIDNDSIYKLVKPSLLEANYVIAKAQNDPNAPELYSNYVSANNIVIKDRRSTQTILGQNRFSAHKVTMNETIATLNESNNNIKKQTDLIKLLASFSVLFFVGSILALYKAYLSRLSTVKARNLNDKRQKVTNRLFKDAFHKSKRFKKRLEKSLEKARRNTDDLALVAIIDDIGDELYEYDRDQVKFAYIGRRNIGTNKPISERVDLTTFVNTKSQYWKSQVPGNDIDIRFINDSPLPNVMSDPHMLEIILMEMIEHSIEHTVYGKIDVKFEFSETLSQLTIQVSDTGNGDQHPEIDYMITQEACRSLSAHVGFPAEIGYAHSIKVDIPVTKLDIKQDSTIDRSVVVPLRSGNDQ